MKMTIDNNMGWCPVCGEMMTPIDSELVVGYVNEHWVCNICEIDVTYVFPRDNSRWESEIQIVIEPFAS